jgi:hypothetical protein
MYEPLRPWTDCHDVALHQGWQSATVSLRQAVGASGDAQTALRNCCRSATGKMCSVPCCEKTNIPFPVWAIGAVTTQLLQQLMPWNPEMFSPGAAHESRKLAGAASQTASSCAELGQAALRERVST